MGGAATWLSPHLLVLDEPSNYLDIPALSALAVGLQAFQGGVGVISHNAALLAEACTERWHVAEGVVRRELQDGQLEKEEDAQKADAVSAVTDAKEAKDAKERKRYERLKELRRKQGEEVSDDEEEWWEDLLKKTNAK